MVVVVGGSGVQGGGGQDCEWLPLPTPSPGLACKTSSTESWGESHGTRPLRTQNETKSGMVTEGGTQDGRHWLPQLPAILQPSSATRKSQCSGLSELP